MILINLHQAYDDQFSHELHYTFIYIMNVLAESSMTHLIRQFTCQPTGFTLKLLVDSI